MVLKLESATVHGFFGRDKPLQVQFGVGINFLIGLNGTGKTTLINIIRAAIECDSIALAEAPFRAIEIKFNNPPKRNKPIFSIFKGPPLTPTIEYTFISKAGDTPIEAKYHPDRTLPYRDYILGARSQYREEGLDKLRRELPNIVWLSIYRGTFARPDFSASDELNPIDRKITDIVTATTRYLSSLDKSYSTLLEDFQQRYFLSLINSKQDSVAESYSYDMDAERRNIEDIANELFRDPKSHKRSISEHFVRAQDSIKRYRETQRLTILDAIIISDTIRLHKIAGSWQELQTKKAEIYRKKTIFEEIMSDMYIHKKLSFNARNQPVIIADTSNLGAPRIVDLKSLSSGEKQLFIIFGSALLQEERDFLFMADEPELSLHIEWQRSLVTNLRRLNSNAQIVFATHSPDIVAEYGRDVIRMESIL